MGWLFSFFGRIGRGRFWGGVAMQILMMVVFAGAAMAVQFAVAGPESLTATNELGEPQPQFSPVAMAILGVGYILVLWSSLAVAVKRAHDRGKSGWWILIMLVPIVGFIWWLVDLGILEGQEGPNKYGPDPQQA